MKIIEKLTELIDEEISDIGKYAKLAAEMKTTNPSLAQVFYNLSTQEDAHQAVLHGEVVKIIENHRKTKGEPPKEMMAIYDFIHRKHIEKLSNARRYQELYKNT